MFEHRSAPLLSRTEFFLRFLRSAGIAAFVITGSLGMGAAGYHITEKLTWLDSILNASMILSGMGPVHNPETPGGKVFATCYALFSGIAFLTITAVLFAPVAHRFLHHFHMEVSEEDNARADAGKKRARKTSTSKK